MPEQAHFENEATEIGMQSVEQFVKINALTIKGLTTKFHIATILYTCISMKNNNAQRRRNF